MPFVMCLAAIQTAVAQFDDWQHPWKFHDAVSSTLPSNEKAEFETVWQTAMDDKHWNAADFQQCAANAIAAVEVLFPRLETRAVKAIVNAAAYQWK